MSVTALITGRLISDPERRTGTSGKAFTLARIGTQSDGEDMLVSAIAFSGTAEQLAALAKGDTVDALLTAYQLRRKRSVPARNSDRAEEEQ